MTKIYRNNFVQQHQGRNLDIDKVSRDMGARMELQEGGMTMEQLRRADRNSDGIVDPTEAFRIADSFDRDGSGRSLISETPDSPTAQGFTPAGRSASVLSMMLQRDDLQGTPEVATPTPASAGENDDVLLLGMGTETLYSAGAKHEIKELRKTGANVTGIMDSKYGNDVVRVGGRNYDLSTDSGRDGFVQTLGLPPDQSQKIADVLGKVGADAKDEMAQLAQVWAKGEKGQSIPSRMILSGHHVGSAVWGDNNGSISWDNLKALSEAMPNAASQVKDLHLSACYSGGDAKFQKYQGIFPNVKTIWAYSGSAPGTGSGATHHQAAWERATRGGGTDVEGTADRLKARGLRKAENIDAGTIDRIQSNNAGQLDQMRDAIAAGEDTFFEFFSGQQEVTNSQRGPLRDHYNDVQELLQQPGLPDGERQELEARRDQTIRTLFYDSHIKHRFAETYEHQLQEGFGAVGMQPPPIGEMPRGEALEAIREFREHVDQMQHPPQAAQDLLPLLSGLWNLDSQVIPETWI